ncbi:cytochrome P450 716B2-like [Selaginella moellendorffii]|uniref:cytochrome P450 716B2-like n=1 Tax=Selaginella moellendorffii TaxID=88036 RepID=UPI000D1C762E|nr:cytochrome P450 716B2-like [Selaginella moellendorffii]|eukprot:XP_024531730.1 cytochrome P450 716B2-like [Selaginella moellendorffii]
MLEFPGVIAVVSLVLAGIWIWRAFSQKSYDPTTPPGSFGLPFLGETLHLLYSMKANDLSGFYESRERKYGQVFKTHLFGHPTVVVSPPLGFKFLFSNHGKLVESSWPAPVKMLMGDKSLFFMEGQKAKSFRHILMAFLGPEAMRRYVGRSSSIAQAHIKKFWLDESEVRAYVLLKKAMFSAVFNLFLSIQNEEEERELLVLFEEFLHGMLELPINFPGTKFRRAKLARHKIFEKLDKYISKRKVEIQEGKASAEQDLLSVLLTTRGEDGELMSAEEVKQNILMMVLAGHDTTASTLAVSIKCIAENPWCYDRLRQEHLAIAAAKDSSEPLRVEDLQKMNYTWKVVQEAMRLLPPALGNTRIAITQMTIEGFTVPKDWRFMWSVFQSNRRSAFFPEPDKFDPERFDASSGLIPYTYVPFGGGPRICPGNEFAKMLVRVFLHHLLTQFQWSLVDAKEHVQMAPIAAPANGLHIKLSKNSI